MQYLYLHGFLSGPGSGKGTFLYRKFQQLGKELIRPDLNDGNFERMTISSQLNLAEKILSDINESVILIGSSLGGYLSLLLAERLPKVKKLVLIAPAFDFSERYLSRMDPALMSQWKKRGFIKLYHYGNQRKERLDYGMAEDAVNYQKLKINRKIDCIIFHGINDESVPYLLSIEYLQQNPNASLCLLNTDHGMLDKLEEMWQYLLPYLEFNSK